VAIPSLKAIGNASGLQLGDWLGLLGEMTLQEAAAFVRESQQEGFSLPILLVPNRNFERDEWSATVRSDQALEKSTTVAALAAGISVVQIGNLEIGISSEQQRTCVVYDVQVASNVSGRIDLSLDNADLAGGTELTGFVNVNGRAAGTGTGVQPVSRLHMLTANPAALPASATIFSSRQVVANDRSLQWDRAGRIICILQPLLAAGALNGSRLNISTAALNATLSVSVRVTHVRPSYNGGDR
jgi:hypothetical protein